MAALTNFGGYAEYIYWDAQELVHVPTSLDPAQAVVLILNYLTAYQAMHRVAKVQTGDKILIVGASGGVGTALLQLGKVAGLKMVGPFRQDWTTLFHLLEEGKIKPVIAEKYPILEAARANALLESGHVTGNVVLLAPAPPTGWPRWPPVPTPGRASRPR